MSQNISIRSIGNNFFIIICGDRSDTKNRSGIEKLFNLFEIIFSPFLSARILQRRYFQSRLLILKELKNLNTDLTDVKVSISHNKKSFIALISKRNFNIAIDHEPIKRHISNALASRLELIKRPRSLSPIKFINMVETFVKIKNQKWQSFISDIEISEILNYPHTYITNIEQETIYSKFYSYNDSNICISSDNFEVLM